MEAINNVILGIFAVLGIVGAIGGLSKGLVRSAVKVLTIILAIVVAFAVTPTVLAKAYELALPTIDDLLSPIGEMFVASPTLKEYFPTLVKSLITPIVFIVAFAVCLLGASLVRAIVNAILKAILPKKKGLLGRVGGLACGLVGGVLIALCFVFPVTGYFTAAPSIYVNVREVVYTEENPADPAVEEIIINLPNGQAVKTVNDTASTYFTKLVSYNNGETDVSALDDLVTITSLVQPALEFIDGVGDLSTMEGEPLREMAQILQGHTKLRTIATEIFNYASKKWLANDSFMGINVMEKYEADSVERLVLAAMLADLAVATPDNIVDVLNDIAGSIETARDVLG